MVEVKNIHGSTDNEPKGYNSWKDFWEAQTGRRFVLCSCKTCFNPATVGAHVMKANSDSRKWYIVPLCDGCNHEENVFSVHENDLVPVNP